MLGVVGTDDDDGVSGDVSTGVVGDVRLGGNDVTTDKLRDGFLSPASCLSSDNKPEQTKYQTSETLLSTAAFIVSCGIILQTE